MKKYFSNIIVFVLCLMPILAQAEDDERVRKVDSIFVYKPAQPIEIYNPNAKFISNSICADVIFSNSGFGGGLLYTHSLDEDNMLFANFYISGARNTDEIEYWDYNTGRWIVPNKINRLFMIPLTLGYTRLMFQDAIAGSFKPFITGGIGPTFIISTPYEKEWFTAWNYAKTYVRLDAYIGVGAYFSLIDNSVSSANIRYYYIPFGGNGLESIRGLPIKDFGGLVLSVSVGYTF
ncbi:hypothetical protein LLG34_01190 [bacterium]|nr:hypothetical protein [bacterium]